MEKRTGNRCDKNVEAKNGDLKAVTYIVKDLAESEVEVYINVNNHYAGCAPATIERIKTFFTKRQGSFIMNPIEMKYLWHSTLEKLPAPDEEVLGYASSPNLENFGYNVVTYEPLSDSWHEVNGRRSIPNITHWLPLEPPMKIMVKLHHREVAAREKATRGKRHRRESDRNRDIIIRLLNGQTSQEVGDFYGISHSWVSIIANRIFKKIAPDMDYSLGEMRRIKDYFLKRIEEL